jgi:hypothetical protein
VGDSPTPHQRLRLYGAYQTRGRLYSENTLLERVPQDFQNMAMELRQFIQEEHTMVREGHFTRHQHVAPPISAA